MWLLNVLFKKSLLALMWFLNVLFETVFGRPDAVLKHVI